MPPTRRWAASEDGNPRGARRSPLVDAHLVEGVRAVVGAARTFSRLDRTLDDEGTDGLLERASVGQIREVGTQTGVPCIFGVITADTLEQAINRAGAKMGNAGRNAMLAAVEMANLMKKV